MIIGGFQPFSLIDYPNKISCIVFTQGCNFRCPFCHNPELIPPKKKVEKSIKNTLQDFFSFLEKRKDKLEGVVITGGEPTLQKDLPSFCERIKQIHPFLIKIDTNGTNPKMLKNLIEKGLIDYIAMDIKTRLSVAEYNKVTGTSVLIASIKESINLIKSFSNYEFRTTCVPGIITKQVLIDIAKYLKEQKANKLFYLQQFQRSKLFDASFYNIEPYPLEKLFLFKRLLEKYIEKVELRGI